MRVVSGVAPVDWFVHPRWAGRPIHLNLRPPANGRGLLVLNQFSTIEGCSFTDGTDFIAELIDFTLDRLPVGRCKCAVGCLDG